METDNRLRSNRKKQAISSLKNLRTLGNNDVINIIETILDCYVEIDLSNEKGIPEFDKQTNQTKEERFLIDELTSFIEGIKGLKK